MGGRFKSLGTCSNAIGGVFKSKNECACKYDAPLCFNANTDFVNKG